ncbi:MAG: hypothetical protein IT348_15015 [Candidatus Eisenbacteria bacterium]|nr:hypothetical protein [Candidatus Eisenbacteria bacterium]
MEKAIDIKRRAQRCIQNGDLEGALTEYEKLVSGEESDPYNFVLLADLLYKKGDQTGAAERYLSAVAAYERASLFKNAIAVCKKMLRLSLSPAKVLNSLAQLHLLDGLAGEAALYYVQYAEHMVRSSAPDEAAEALRKAFDACQDNLKVLEQLSEAWLLAGENGKSAQVMLEAAAHYRSRNAESEAVRCTLRASQLDPSVTGPTPIAAAPAAPAAPEPFAPAVSSAFMPAIEAPATPERDEAPAAGAPASLGAIPLELEHTSRVAPRVDSDVVPDRRDAPEGFDSGRHDFEFSTASSPRIDEPAPASSPDDFAVTESDVTASYAELPLGAPAEPPVYEIAEEPIVADVPLADGVEVPADSAEVYEIGSDEGEPIGAFEIETEDEPAEPAGVYEIAIDEDVPVTTALAEAEAAAGVTAEEPVYEIADEQAEVAELQSPEQPGLAFAAAAHPAHAHSVPAANPLEHVEALLAMAQEQFRAGDRDQATSTLTEAARAYELLGRLDSAATIYRSLGRGAQASPYLMEQWLGNCERRADTHEAAQVACELGDRALNDGDEKTASSWFERALSFDASNETARRRLQRLTGTAGPAGMGGVAVASATPAPPSPPPAEIGRVEVAVGRAEAVTFDLAGLLSEFQKGVAAQLAGDAQSHYDLGMTYREMGLLDQAIESFRVAQDDPRLAPRALEMSGRCLADEGRHHEAVGDYRRALGLLDPSAGLDGEIRFHLAQSLTETGEHEDALAEFELVAESLPDYEDVAERIVALRRVLGRA